MSAEVKKVENLFLGVSFWIIVVEREPYFLGKEVAINLGFTKKPENAIERHVDKEDKMTLRELFINFPEIGRFLFGQNKDNMTLKQILEGGNIL